MPLKSSSGTVVVDRPVRWDHPLDPAMASHELQWMLRLPPFSSMNPESFSSNCSLLDILRNDCKIHQFRAGDIVVREGAYGHSAYLILDGTVRAFLEPLWRIEHEDRSMGSDSFLSMLTSRWRRTDSADDRRASRRSEPANQSPKNPQIPAPLQMVKSDSSGNRVFLQDINAVVDGYESDALGVGEIFGEMAAITRTPHRYTVVADSECLVMEIRWQGLRLLRRDRQFREQLDQQYRETSLKTNLREIELFRFLSDESLDKIAAVTRLESFGELEWFADYQVNKQRDLQERIESETLIVSEGDSADDLILIRNGFARVSYEIGNGHQTISYLGRGRFFGLDEVSQNYRRPWEAPLPYQNSLRALGYVDILRIPKDVLIEYVLPNVRKSELPPGIVSPRYDMGGLVVSDAGKPLIANHELVSLVEFLVDERLINGKRTMMIDLDRCTGCDDCVKACAATHGGTPRFVRNGPQLGPLMFAHACMHCEDPVCMIGCPTGAIGRDSESGVVSINANTCIGCKTCSESCPYENIVMIQRTDSRGRLAFDRQTQLPILQASKCDLCHGIGSGPACQNACPHAALVRLDTSNVVSLTPWLGMKG
jgi:Fe-S-cluster-containing dehydrogenase component/CRP-like cAMP-binding protein